MSVLSADSSGKSPMVVSLFAGCGGSSLGYQWAGYRELLAVDFDAAACETFRLNFPDVPLWEGDIKNLSGTECLRLAGIKRGDLDVLDSSPPCQGFSTAGKRQIGDLRNLLPFEVIRLTKDIQPKVVLMENVRGLAAGHMKPILAAILKELAAAGYHIKVEILNACWFGVPQSRERVIILCIREDLAIEPSFPKPQMRAMTVREAIGDLPTCQVPEIGHTWIDESPEGRDTEGWHLAKGSRQGEVIGKYHAVRRERYGMPAYTVRTTGPVSKGYCQNSPCHPTAHRVLSPLEVMRLCSFPDSFKFAGGYNQAYRQCGNAVPPKMMEAIARYVRMEILRK